MPLIRLSETAVRVARLHDTLQAFFAKLRNEASRTERSPIKARRSAIAFAEDALDRLLRCGASRDGAVSSSMTLGPSDVLPAFADAYAIDVPPTTSARRLADAVFPSAPPWVAALMAVRNAVVAPLGLVATRRSLERAARAANHGRRVLRHGHPPDLRRRQAVASATPAGTSESAAARVSRRSSASLVVTIPSGRPRAAPRPNGAGASRRNAAKAAGGSRRVAARASRTPWRCDRRTSPEAGCSPRRRT